MKKFSILSLVVLLTGFLFAQEAQDVDDGYNKFSTKGIHKSDVMWQKSVLRAIDLREKQNEPLMSNGREMPQILIDAVKAGVITAYKSDSLSDGTPLTKEEFLKNIQIPSTEVELTEEEKEFAANEDSDDDWGDEEGGDDEGGDSDSGGDDASGAEYFFAKQLYQMQVKEDMIFDKQRSVMYYDIIGLGMFVPADNPDNIKGIELPIAWFSFKELIEKVFKDNPDAIWYNPYNDAEHRSLADAFELRLFSSYIIKVSNPADEYIVDIYGGNPQVGIMASEWKAYELLEYEHNLWEF
jgi:gliding motility associated protien GldN